MTVALTAAASPIIRVGVVGCGEVAQTTHLPTFALLSHLYKVTALCDVSTNALAHCSTKFGVGKTYTNFSDLVKDPGVDLVFILTADEYHAPYAVEAADHGKAVFIEKPMALTREDASAISSAQKRNNVVIFVGYMRRYAAAFDRMKAELGSIKNIRYARIRDIIGFNHFFVNESATFPQTFTDFPPSASGDRQARTQALLSAALTPSQLADPRNHRTYRLLGGLGSHDLSAMRELLGMPRRCLAASRAQGEGPPFLQAMFDYGSYTALYETGLDHVASFDASVEVMGDGKRVKLVYDTPYIKGLPVTIEVKETDEHGQYTEKTIRPSYKDAYTLELESLHASLTEGKPVKTSPADAALDLELFSMIMDKLEVGEKAL
ncbi:hypothetical protein JCM10207_001763 [Rhodosporidiobolus poonsookiae]